MPTAAATTPGVTPLEQEVQAMLVSGRKEVFTGLFQEAVALAVLTHLKRWEFHSSEKHPTLGYVSGPIQFVHGASNIYGRVRELPPGNAWDDFLALRVFSAVRQRVVEGKSTIDKAIASASGHLITHGKFKVTDRNRLHNQFFITVDYVLPAPVSITKLEFGSGNTYALISVELRPPNEHSWSLRETTKFIGDATLNSLVYVPPARLAEELSTVGRECLVGPSVYACDSQKPSEKKPGFGRLQEVLNAYVQMFVVPKLKSLGTQ